jgi:preprotein translocase subunit YajC
MQDDIVEGDEIITAGGMHAIVREAGETELRIEIAPGVVVTLDRRAVAAVAQDVDEPADDEDEATGDSGTRGGDALAGPAAGENDPVAS